MDRYSYFFCGGYPEQTAKDDRRINIALKKAGNIVGYLGDSINDTSALNTADVGICAVHLAKEATLNYSARLLQGMFHIRKHTLYKFSTARRK